MSRYETQEPLDDPAEQYLLDARNVDTAPGDAQAQPSASGRSPKFHVFYHAYKELYKRSCELLTFAQSRVSDSSTGLLGSVADEIRNQSGCLAMFDEYLKNVWVQIYLDDSGRFQVSQMMSLQTTIQGVFSQLPQVAQSLLEVVLDNSPPLASDFSLRLVCDFPEVLSSAGQNFDLPVHSSVTLEEIMREYIPGTFQLSFRLLYQGEPVNLAALILEHLSKSCREGSEAIPVQAQQTRLPKPSSRNQTCQVRLNDCNLGSAPPAQHDRSPSIPGTGVAMATNQEMYRQKQGRTVVDHVPLHEKPLSAKDLLASSLLLDLQDWDRLARRYAGRDRSHHASAAKERVDSPGITASQDILPNVRAEAVGRLPVHEQAERKISASDTGHIHAQSVGRGRKRQRVKSATTSPAADPAAATTEPAEITTLLQGAVQPQLPPHLVRSPVGHAPDTPARFQWKVEDVALLLKGIQTYGKQWSTIQSQYFRAHPGTSFQSKMKDKWRSLCQVIEKKHAARKSLPEHLWKQVESLKKLHGMQ